MEEVSANKIDLIYKLEGEIEEGINVFDLSPILLNLGQLIQESNNILNPGGREIAVNVKPFEKGSFIVDISVFAQNNLQQAIDLVSQEGVKNVKEILEWIGLVGGAGMSVIGLIKYLKGKPKSVKRISPGEVRYTPKEGNAIEVNNKVNSLFGSPKIQTFIFQTCGKPFDIPRVEGVRTYIKEDVQSKERSVEIPVSESGYFKEFEEPELFDDSEMTKESRTILLLNPKRGSFEGSKGPYSFTISGDQQSKLMDIRDEGFRKKLESGEIRLHYSDLLEVELLIIQKVKENKIESVSYHIQKVINYTKATPPKNIELFDASR